LYESLEGMRVLVQRPRVVGPSRSGHEFWVVPESSTVATTQRGGLSGADESANAARICVRSDEEVALDVGNRFDEDLQGVFGGHGPCLQVQRVPAASSTLERQQLPWSAPRANELSLATLNVHNLSIATGGERFNRLARDFRNVLGLPDVVLLNEIQDDSADTDDGVVSAEQTLTGLSDAVEQQSHVRYAWAEIDPVDGQDGGQPGANIRQVFFYRSDRGLQLAATDGGLAAYLPTNPVRLKPSDPAFVASRKPLVVAFTFGATRLVLLGNHFVSKTIDEPDWGRQQPPRHPSETQRIAQAQVLATFVEQLLSAAPEACVVVLGDMNDTHDSAALAPLRDIGFRSLFETLPATERYSYVFEGNSEALDHLFVDAAGAALVTQFAAVHSHAEFAQADSDHDPLVARLRLPLP
jgi:uncharacterized protein